MLHTLPDFTPPYADLVKLASTQFLPADFRRQCETFARYSESNSFEDLWYFKLNVPRPTLMVSVEVDYTKERGTRRQKRVRFAVLPFVGWEDFRSDDKTGVRQQFDDAFKSAIESASSQIGPPDDTTTYSSDNFHRAVWNGSTGVMLVQQSNYDPQFGAEIHCWMQSHGEQMPD